MDASTPGLERLVGPVARHLGIDPAGVHLRRIPTGKFNETYSVEGGPGPLLKVSPHPTRGLAI